MLHIVETIIFSILLALTFYGFFYPLYLRYKLIKKGKPENRFDSPFKRVKDAVVSFFFLTCSVKKERVVTGLVHFFILYGSLTFDTVSLSHVLEGYKEGLNVFGHGLVRSIHTAWVDVFAIMVLVAAVYFIIRRYVFRPHYYTYPSKESFFIYTLLITVTITFLLYEGAVIAHNPAHGYWSFFGKVVAGWMGTAGMGLVKLFWWIHILNVFAFVLYVPRSKYLHMMAGPVNIAFQNYNPKAAVKPLNLEVEDAEKFGVVDATDLTWKDLLDSFACVDCGRCDDYCPANSSGKPLSPKNIMLRLKEYLLREKDALLKKENPDLPPLMAGSGTEDGSYTEDEIWTCTTCGACMHVCPVMNEHVPKIIGLRQSMTLMESRFPEELNLFFKGMETNSNPWGIGSGTRAEWAEDLDIKILSQDKDVDILYWVGCAGAFDDRAKKVSTALVKILKKAGVNFGILGVEENCCGDQARRLGNEYMFQMLAQQNIEILKKYNIKKILVTCPHGYNTFKNEYPEYAKTQGIEDWDIEVVHHSEFIKELLDQGKLAIEQELKASLTYHDPCYLGRHNHVFKPPRQVLAQTGVNMKEMKDNWYHSFCCGAGGGLMWTEETLGKRINHMRTENVLNTGAEIVSTACPFCMTMLEDGIKDKEKEEACSVKDIAEIVAQCITGD